MTKRQKAPAAPQRPPERTCIGCGAKRERGSLVRLVLDPGGHIRVDRKGTGPGRGAWLCGPGCLRAALKRKAFARAFRGKAAPFEPEALAEALGTEGGAGLQREEIGLHAAPHAGDAARRKG